MRACGRSLGRGRARGQFRLLRVGTQLDAVLLRHRGRCEGARGLRGAGRGWSLHGLWPQFETGWPSYCQGAQRNPSRRDTAAEADLFGSGGSAWHQWNKHGRCTGLSAADYYDLSRLAYERITRPEVFRRLDRTFRLPARVVETAFLEANPDIEADGLTVTCRDGYVQEVRICLTRGLEPRLCGRDVRRDCTLDNAQMDPVR